MCEIFRGAPSLKAEKKPNQNCIHPPLTPSDKVCLRSTTVGLTLFNRRALKLLTFVVDTPHFFHKSKAILELTICLYKIYSSAYGALKRRHIELVACHEKAIALERHAPVDEDRG